MKSLRHFLTVPFVLVCLAGATVSAQTSTAPQSQSVLAGGNATLSTTATGTVQWQRNGTAIAGATSASLTLSNIASTAAGLYSAVITNGSTVTTQTAVVGVGTAAKVIGSGTELNANVTHPSGAIYDQILPQGAAVTVTADAGQATRISFIDLNDDIVQVEFSGAGTLSLVLDSATGPATPTKYTQNVNYMKGHAGITITGANETTHVAIFSVGRATAYDPTGGFDIRQPVGSGNDPANNANPLFAGRSAASYDGVADVAFVAIHSTNGKFGGLRAGNAGFFATAGYTGIYAPDVTFTGPVYIHDINASTNATGVLLLGSASDVRVTGGDLQQTNARAVQVSGVTELKFTAGSNSHGTSLAAQNNQARLERAGVEVTSQIVINPTPSGGNSSGPELTFSSGSASAPYANGAKKRFEASATTLRFDTTTLTNPVKMSLTSPYAGYQFTDAATGIVWEVIFRNDALYEINLMKSGQFLGQWS